MKTMTCREMGGECDKEISAASSAEMAQNMTKHVMAEHPDTAKEFESMTEEDHKKWEEEFHKNWEKAPEAE